MSQVADKACTNRGNCILRVAHSHVHLVKGLNALVDGFLGGPMLSVLLHEFLKGPPSDGFLPEDIVRKVRGIDPLQLLALPMVDTHHLVKGDTMGRLPLLHA